MPTAYERRFRAAADADPQGFEQFIRNKLGVSGYHGAKLLDLHGKLHRGGSLSKDDVQMIQRAYEGVYSPQEIADAVHSLEAYTQPGERRARVFLAYLAGDEAVAEDRLHDATPGYKELSKLASEYHRHELVDAIDAKTDAAKPRDLHKVEVQRPAVDPLSTRELIERHYEEPGVREFAAAVEEGNEFAERLARDRLADNAQRAVNTLHSDDASTRESVAAAFDLHAVEDVGRDQGWLPEKE